jgi:hypothetical protein
MTYPQEVQDYSEEIVSYFKKYYDLDEFSNPDDFINILTDMICEKCLKLWVEDSTDFRLDAEELEKITSTAITQTHLNSLLSKGLIDGVENEHGEMVYFATKEGKKFSAEYDEKN